MLGYAGQGLIDVGQVLATIARIQDGDADGWSAAWLATARALQERATASRAAGNRETAAREFLGAAECYSQAVGFIDRMSDASVFAPTFALHRQCWEAFVDAGGDRVQRLAVPYEGTTLPGYLFLADTSGSPRPTLVMTNGSDGSLSALWASGASTALARGFHAFLYDGPGQQSMLFDHQMWFRPDWEKVLTPVVDTVGALPQVDEAALVAYGISQAGYWVTRALAFEHRFVAAVVDPGVVDVSTSWLGHLPPELVTMLEGGDRDTFDAIMAQVGEDPKEAATMAFRARPYGASSPFDTFTAVLGYTARDVAASITTPLLITSPDDEVFWPGQSDELAGLLTCEHDVVRFSREAGANYHCEPMGRAAVEAAMFDFFNHHLHPSPE